MKEYKDLIDYIITLLANPSDFEIHRQVHEEKILQLLNAFADSRPPTIEQMVEILEETYPSIQTSVDLIEKGDGLRTEMLDSVFGENFQAEEVKKYEARISLFEKMIGFDATITTLIRNLAGNYTTKKKTKTKLEVDGSQGSAQALLSQLENGKKN